MTTNSTTPQLEADIERQRDELAATVSELQARLDVKTRAQEKAGELRDRATTDEGSPRPGLLAAGGGVLFLLTTLVVWKVRRSRKDAS